METAPPKELDMTALADQIRARIARDNARRAREEAARLARDAANRR